MQIDTLCSNLFVKMSGIGAEKVYEYFSSVKEAREYINKRIENLIQVIEHRKSFLNCELDGLEQNETQAREKLEKLVEYEKSTVDLFNVPEHLHIIQSKIVAIEFELSCKKLKLEWIETGLEKQLESLGNVIVYAQDQGATNSPIYDDVVIADRKPEIKIHISGNDALTNYPEEGLEEYECMNLKNEIIAELNPTDPNPSTNSKNVLLPSIFDNTNSPPQYETANPGDDDIIYETTSSEENPSYPVEKKIENIIYKEHSQKRVEPKRCNSFNTIKGNFTDSTSVHNNNNIPTFEKESYYEVMHNSYSTILDDPLTRDYEELDAITLTTAGTIPNVKTPPKVKTQRFATFGRAKPKAKYDLPQIAKCWKGSGIEQLDRPKAVCISEKGNIFVAEKGNNRVQVFSSEGNHLLTFGEKSGANKMVEPNGICVYREFVYVTLPNKHIVQQYTVQGGFIKQKGKKGSEEGMFKLPTGIDGDDSRGKIYICDTGNNRIQIFDSKLRFIKSLQTDSLVKPLDIKIIKNGDFIVLDRSPKCIHFFNNSGEHLKEIINVSSHLQLVNPLYFTVSRVGDIILSDYSKDCIHIFTVEGDYVWTLGEAGSGKPFVEPRGVACDRDGRLVTVCNKNYEMLQIFKI